MPEEIPKFDPNKPYKDVSNGTYKEANSSSTPPPFDPNKPYRSAATQDFQQEGFSPDKYTSQGIGEVDEKEIVEQKIDKIITNNYPDISEGRKKTFKDYAMSGASAEDIKDAILTFQGMHPKQEGSNNFYMKEVAPKVYKPIPLKKDEKPPSGYDVASVWGDQNEAENDIFVTSLAKHLWNGAVDATLGISKVAGSLQTAITGQESSAQRIVENKINKFRFETKKSEEEQIFKGDDIKEGDWKEYFNPDRYNLTKDNVQGQILNGLQTVMSVAAGTGGGSSSKIANKMLTGASSYNLAALQMSEVADEAGLDGRNKAAFVLIGSVPQALLEVGLGTTSLLNKNLAAKAELKEFAKGLASNLEKDAAGNFTKASLEKLNREMTIAAAKVNTNLLKEIGGSLAEEGIKEVSESFAEESTKALYDKLSQDPKFHSEVFSPESINKYVNSFIGGVIGASGLNSVGVIQRRKIAKKELESKNAYAIASKGDEAINAFNEDIDNKLENGYITKEQADLAKFKVNAYSEYNKTTENLSLDDENKRKLFDLSFQKENLKAAIKEAEAKDTEGHSRLDKMNPAELGLHNAKMKQAKALQEEIDLIVAKSEILQQPEVPEKIVEKVIKEEEKAAETPKVKEGVSSEIGAILGRQYKVKVPPSVEVSVPKGTAYTPPAKVLSEKRKMQDIPTEDWNSPEFDVTVKQHKLADALEEAPEKTTIGTLQQDNYFINNKGEQVQTFNITLPDGKTARFASSKVRYPEENAAGGFRGNTYEENLTNRENPIGQKVGATVRKLKDSGRKVIFLWNADEGPKYGKHIGMVKERLRGKSDYSEADLDEMADLRMLNMGQNPNAPAPGIITPEGPVEGGPKVSIPFTITTDMRRQLADLGYKKADVQDMKPEEANDIIESQRTKPKSKTELKEVEVKEKKESKIKVKKAPKEIALKEENIAKRQKLMDAIRVASKLVTTYNNLTKAQKKSEDGVKLYKNIQGKAEELGYSTIISRGGTLKLINEKGKQVYKTPVKRTEDQKAIEAERKEALRAEPTSIVHAVILDVANGVRFNAESLKKYFSEDVLKKMPSLLKDNKNGVNIEFYKTRFEEEFGNAEIANLDEEEVSATAAAVLEDYFIDKFREAAIQDAVDINFKTKNNNMSREDVAMMEEMAKQNEKEQQEIDEFLAKEDLEKEEYRKQAEQQGYFQKAKVKPTTLNKFKQSVDLFYQTKDADGATKKRSLAAERREFLEKNPSIKYIDDNMKYIYKQLEEKNIIERKGECP